VTCFVYKSAGRFICDGCLTSDTCLQFLQQTRQTYYCEHDSLGTCNMTQLLPISAMQRKHPSIIVSLNGSIIMADSGDMTAAQASTPPYIFICGRYMQQLE